MLLGERREMTRIESSSARHTQSLRTEWKDTQAIHCCHKSKNRIKASFCHKEKKSVKAMNDKEGGETGRMLGRIDRRCLHSQRNRQSQEAAPTHQVCHPQEDRRGGGGKTADASRITRLPQGRRFSPRRTDRRNVQQGGQTIRDPIERLCAYLED